MKNDISQNFASEYQGTLCEVLTADNIARAFDVDVLVNELPYKGRTVRSVIPVSIFDKKIR